jgi:hypothetical protein
MRSTKWDRGRAVTRQGPHQARPVPRLVLAGPGKPDRHGPMTSVRKRPNPVTHRLRSSETQRWLSPRSLAALVNLGLEATFHVGLGSSWLGLPGTRRNSAFTASKNHLNVLWFKLSTCELTRARLARLSVEGGHGRDSEGYTGSCQ